MEQNEFKPQSIDKIQTPEEFENRINKLISENKTNQDALNQKAYSLLGTSEALFNKILDLKSKNPNNPKIDELKDKTYQILKNSKTFQKAMEQQGVLANFKKLSLLKQAIYTEKAGGNTTQEAVKPVSNTTEKVGWKSRTNDAIGSDEIR
ncbi:MAG: hypothetical protein ACK4NC_03920 [Candidatus Gracilibacteria bacterium]